MIKSRQKLRNILETSHDNPYLRPTQKEFIIQEFKNTRTILGDHYNHLVFLSSVYSFLFCADSLVDVWLEKWDEKKVGPLNKNIEFGYALYLHGTSMLATAAKECEFPEQDVQINFSTSLSHLIFWPVDSIVHGVHIPQPAAPFFKWTLSDLRDTVALAISLRIAVLPLDCALFDSNTMRGNDTQPFIRMRNRGDSSIYWEYLPEGQTRITKKVISFLEAALERDPHIIVFPEYCIGPEQLEAIKNYIANHKTILNMKNLKFIVAGTTWTTVVKTDDIIEHDNICHVLSSCDCWRSYKEAEYCGVEWNELGLRYFNKVETLSNPAKELAIPYIQNVGFVQIPICRDVINSENADSITGIIAQRVAPALILVPACSPSHDRFISPLTRFARIHHSCAILCNCCSAAAGTHVGLVGVPQKTQQIHDIFMASKACERGLCSEKCVLEDCRCIFMAEITNRVNYTRDSIDFSISRI